MKRDFSVVIPTYNGSKTLPLVLERLRSQEQTETLTWEVIVVDNNSTDDTATIVKALQVQWPSQVPLKYCFEPRQGISYARQRGVAEAQGTFVGFLDDDNLPDSNWVAAAYAFGQNYPMAGAYGGRIRGRFEVPPPPDFKRARAFLVIRNYTDYPRRFDPSTLQLPAGAGLVVRRQAWLTSMPDQLVRVNRGGNDYEISLHLHNAGWEIWYTPSLQIEHYIKAERLERVYLIRLAYQYGLCTSELRLITARPWQMPWVLSKNFVGSLRRLLWHVVKHRQQVMTNLDLACELAHCWGSVLSPLYYCTRFVVRKWN
ncbi:MAG: glycosyltransferase family 2 protein [Synechococcales cyanobacterium M58_A2018_015]|nr:glycosyltransferase family 2 protein [Synechococcales cyanobacterium M58_A2018_015]